ncbi:MAG: DNA adenine methylase [Blastochloris sp.]|nr:DNA adenine methylase [Blastochloris sp.]
MQPESTLFDMDGIAVAVQRPVNVASVPQRSPFRYPGGKTWFIPRLREWLKSKNIKPRLLVEPFAGGGIVSLTAAFEDLVDSVLMVELDEEVAAVWETIVSGKAGWLARRIQEFSLTRDNVHDLLSQSVSTTQERAFQTIVKNRTFHGGILAAGSGLLKNGEAGRGLKSRWYPATLAKRLQSMDHVLHKINFKHGDAFAVLEEYQHSSDAVFFLDPPYTAGGKNAGSRLYNYSKIDHETLFSRCRDLSGDFLMTYDNSEEVRKLAVRYGFQAKPISMKNTHHAEMTELVIGRDLSWMSGIRRVLQDTVIYGSRKRKKPL